MNLLGSNTITVDNRTPLGSVQKPAPTPLATSSPPAPTTLTNYSVNDIHPQALAAHTAVVGSQSNIATPQFLNALLDKESSYGNPATIKNDAGKYGYLVGFTKGLQKNILQKQQEGDPRYANISLHFDTPRDAIESAAKWIDWLSTHYNTKDPGEIYAKYYNASKRPGIQKIFNKLYQARSAELGQQYAQNGGLQD